MSEAKGTRQSRAANDVQPEKPRAAPWGISSKIQDTIAISTLIDQGPPARYQLVTKKQSLDKDQFRRWTFGERDPSKINKTILMVGETGSGKSSLINAMVNYVLGVEWKDKVWFEIIEDEKRSQTESQTTAITVYEVFGCEGLRVPYSLTIIDTPGYGDTRGIQEDKLIAEKLLELFRSTDGIHEFDAVCLVVKASENRLSERQKYIFDAVLSLFGKDMVKNIVALITHSDGGEPTNALNALEVAKVPGAKNEKNQPVHFLFNNRKLKANCETEKQANIEESIMNTAWKTSQNGMEEFTEFLGRITPQNVKMSERVLRERKQLEACVSNLQGKIEMIDLKQNEIKQTQEALEKHKIDMDKNKDFSYTVEESYKEKVPIESSWWHLTQRATICDVCEENCHYPDCWWVNDISWCSVMKESKCTVCTGKCPSSKHVKENKIYVGKTKNVTTTYENLKIKYEINEKAAGEKGNVLTRLHMELEQVTLQKVKLVEESYQCVIKLEEIALKAISLSAAVHLDFLIDKMKETGNTEKVQKLEEMKKRPKEEHTCEHPHI
ncbi:uncharacterized protein LOC123482944 [Coregonus clupeaformis]|uniref:uncharacterized protein LOC123482944 n=1 Tax=Coregonus clupeaformis TaxID=59861 RepID=UPI001E1C55C5|nr:uncharacterized protein LOC123482944 [Coregonus clupeaformis]